MKNGNTTATHIIFRMGRNRTTEDIQTMLGGLDDYGAEG